MATFILAQSLLKKCENDNRDFPMFLKKTQCKKTLAILMEFLGLGNNILVKRLSHDNSKFSKDNYKDLKFLLQKTLHNEFGIKLSLFVAGTSESTISIKNVLEVILDLLECKKKYCSNQNNDQIMQCTLSNCNKTLVTCINLAIDLYTNVPCFKGFEIQCKKGMDSFKKNANIIIKKLSTNKSLTKKEFDDLEHNIKVLIMMI
jgi:hypothetical protein